MFKFLTLAAAPMLIATGAPNESSGDSDICPIYEELAEKIMTARQYGMRISDVLSADEKESPEFTRAFRPMVFKAYESPAYSTDERRQDAIREYGQEVALSCYRSKER